MRKTAGMDPATAYAAVILAGGTAARMGGVDKAGVEYAGHTLLEHALRAVADAAEVVVVGEQVPTSRPVTFVREDPPQGGPAAGLLAGFAALARAPEGLVRARRGHAVRHRGRRSAGWSRPRTGTTAHSSSTPTDGASSRACWTRRRSTGPVRPTRTGSRSTGCLQTFDLAAVAAAGDEARDVDTWTDLGDLPERPSTTGLIRGHSKGCGEAFRW